LGRQRCSGKGLGCWGIESVVWNTGQYICTIFTFLDAREEKHTGFVQAALAAIPKMVETVMNQSAAMIKVNESWITTGYKEKSRKEWMN
jgi:hypothetical protein